MSAAQPTVWILVHGLSRTGVPMVLLRLLRALPTEAASVHVVALHDGPLRGPLSGVGASLTVLEPADRRSWSNAAAAGLASMGVGSWGSLVEQRRRSVRLRHLPEPDVVVVHGAGAWPLVASVPGSPPVVLHLHELATGLDRCIPPSAQAGVLRSVRALLAVSEPVADLALERGAVASRVEVVPGVVELTQPSSSEASSEDGVRPVMGAGVPGWRKGTDRLAAIAIELARSGRPDHVAWVGGAPKGVDAPWVTADDPVRWVAARPDPWELLRGARVIAVPSREDPLPLVALEAGVHRRPVVAMPTGGLPELLAGGRGRVAPAHDVSWFTAAVSQLLDEPAMAEEMGAALGEEVRRRYDVALVAPRWWSAVLGAAAG